MGQRHQIYVAYKPADGLGHLVVGAHHQWLYGRTAGLQAARLVQCLGSSDFRSLYLHEGKLELIIKNALQSVLTSIPEKGYFTDSLFIFGKDDVEPSDPRRGDNNDGITIVDFREPEDVRYCLMAIEERGLEGERTVKPFVPLSVKEYVEAYYPPHGKWARKAKKKDVAVVEAEIREIVKRLAKVPLLTPKDVADIFPVMKNVLLAETPVEINR